MYDLEADLGPNLTEFVGRHVRSLLTWDIVVFFHRNPGAAVDVTGLATRLGRRSEDIAEEIDALCHSHVLDCAGGIIRYRPSVEMKRDIGSFVDACQDKNRRLALIALVLQNIDPGSMAEA